MADRVRELIDALALQPHPEGGWYAEVHRSPLTVTANGTTRSAVTTIYFLLEGGQRSRWHRIDADEIWHFYEGSPLELAISTDLQQVERMVLGEWDRNRRPVGVVPAGSWQAARSAGGYTLVGCTVGPGFEFSTFEMLSDEAFEEASSEIRSFVEE